MKSRFIIVNAIVVALAIAAWRVGLFDAFYSLGGTEFALLAALGAYTAIGLGAAWCGKWATVRHVANALPAWGLGFTGIGLLLAASQLHSLTPEALSSVFRSLVFSVAPNICGVVGFAWLTVLAYWAGGEET